MLDGKALLWPRMKYFWLREIVGGDLLDPLPRRAILLAATPQGAQQALDVVVEGAECRKVGWHGMVREESPHDLRQPSPLFGYRLVHSPSQLLLDLRELYPHAISPGFPFELELARARAPADENEAQEFEGLRFSEPAPRASVRRMAAKLVQAGLVRMERQRELL